MAANFSEFKINAEIESFGSIANKYFNELKVFLDEGDNIIQLSPPLQDENNEEAIFIMLTKTQALTLAAALNVFANNLPNK